jgi:hypothetical protein
MTSLKILAAAAIVAISAPAFASDGAGNSQTIDLKVIQFAAQGQTPRLVEGRNSDRIVVQTSKAQAATSQGFAPVDTDAALRGSNR